MLLITYNPLKELESTDENEDLQSIIDEDALSQVNHVKKTNENKVEITHDSSNQE